MQRPTKPLSDNDAAALANITTTDDDLTARLQSQGLNVKRVTRNPAGGIVVHWRKPATEEQMALAQELVGQPASHAF